MSATHFPTGFKCDPVLLDMYPEVERQMMPIIKAKSKRLHRYVRADIEDSIQEGRLALLNAMIKYDYNRGGGNLINFVGAVLTNTFKALMYEALTQSRMPRVSVRGEDGEWLKVPRMPLSLDSILFEVEDDRNEANPEYAVCYSELEREARVFRMKMINKLKDRELDVFLLKVNPPAEFLKMVQNVGGNVDEPTNVHIAKYLGIDKNAVDWALYSIKMMFTKLSKLDEFSELFGDSINVRGGWPMIHKSKSKWHDVEFVQRVIKQRKLDPKPIAGYHLETDHCETSGIYARLIERYSWGAVLVIRRGEECVTLVLEGRFNARDGCVIGNNGTREMIPVHWYKQLSRKLQETR